LRLRKPFHCRTWPLTLPASRNELPEIIKKHGQEPLSLRKISAPGAISWHASSPFPEKATFLAEPTCGTALQTGKQTNIGSTPSYCTDLQPTPQTKNPKVILAHGKPEKNVPHKKE
jgi:hypothetical protein